MSVAPGLQAESWHLLTLIERAPGFHILADTLADLVDEGHPIVAGTADLKYSNGLVAFQERHPDRYVQFGISEQHMVSTAAGLATTGLQPYVATFASFMAYLACEQIRTDIAYTKQPVRLIGHHAGITLGFYGTSHHATEDLAITRSIPGLTVIAPADTAQLGAALRAAVDHPAPIYFRIGRGQDPDVYADGAHPFTIGTAIEHGAGTDLTIIATGSMVHPALEAAQALNAGGISTGVVDMHTVKPLDADAVARAAQRSRIVLTVEEHNVIGGLGGAVAEVVAEHGYGTRVIRHGVKDEYALIGPPTHLYRHYKLDAAGIEEVARAAVGS
ncbi:MULTISPECIES: transketolase family protein [unclassified Rhodococcus (in: high G+C Gram-positive bacteria)]|jgi:transketolase|uniref:transketolase family protein n=1 Tax=unclassified Rhodococcus (in: high G+C Gram-positive bacteria) TaxID=192944 RepID=UPI0002F6797B|nr:transketolase C-terminal domain-containing protein [Rhodococcus sp. DK17]